MLDLFVPADGVYTAENMACHNCRECVFYHVDTDTCDFCICNIDSAASEADEGELFEEYASDGVWF